MRFCAALLGSLSLLTFPTCCLSTAQRQNGGEAGIRVRAEYGSGIADTCTSSNATWHFSTTARRSSDDPTSRSTLTVVTVAQTGASSESRIRPTDRVALSSWNSMFALRFPPSPTNTTYSLKLSTGGQSASKPMNTAGSFGSGNSKSGSLHAPSPTNGSYSFKQSTGNQSSISASADVAGNAFTIQPTYPTICYSSTFTYSSTRAAKTGQMLISPAQHVEWSMSPTWNFSASDGGNITRMFVNDGPDTGFGGRVTHNNDPVRNADGSYTLTPKEGSVTRAIHSQLEGRGTGNFLFTVIGVLKCDKPIPKECTVQDHALTQDQWFAFSTDTFLNASVANWTRETKNGSDFWPWFVKQYVGDGFATSCTVDSDSGCGPLTQPCANMKATPYIRQAYLVMASMMQLSRYLRFAYAAFGQAEVDLGSYIPSWDLKFSVPSKESNWKTILAVFASVTGMLSVVAFFAAPFLAGAEAFAASITGAVIFGVSATFNGAINFASAGGADVSEPMFATYATSAASMKQFIEINQWDLISLHNAYFLNATNLTSILLGGVFVGDQLTRQIVDTTNIPASADASLSGKIKGAANWYDKFTILNLLNYAWINTGIYVVHIPYGPGMGYFGGEKFDFKREDCMGKHFWGLGRYNDTMAFCCDCAPGHPGMLVFMNSGIDLEYGNVKPKGFYDVKEYKIIDYAFDFRDVLRSSFASYYTHGYKYNVTHETTREALATGNYNLLKSWTDLKPTDAGVFNLPVCTIYDLAYVPGCYKVGGNEALGCYTQPGICLQNSANYTDSFGGTTFFRDNVVQAVTDSLKKTHTIMETMPPPGFGS